MFIGDYTGKVDAKARIIIPSQFRKNCKGTESFVIKRNVYEKALDLYPLEAWKEEVTRFTAKLNSYNRLHTTLIHEFYRGVAEVSLDASGRILLPKRLMEYASIKKEVIMVGVGDKIIIWDEAIYEAQELSQDAFEDLLSKELGNAK